MRTSGVKRPLEVTVSEWQEAMREAGDLLDAVGRALAVQVAESGKITPPRLMAIEYPAFGYARLLAQAAAARALFTYAEQKGTFAQGLAQAYCAEFLTDLHTFTVLHGGCSPEVKPKDGIGFPLPAGVAYTYSSQALTILGREILSRDREWGGAYGLDTDHQALQQMFAGFADAKVAPLAEVTHRDDRLIPESLLQSYADLGVFGVSIPQSFGGSFVDHLTMVLASEELSRASLGIGGSVVTRPEIAAKAILAGGTNEQKAYWLPLLAQGKKMVCIAVTEPGAGSDVANLQLTARPRDGGFILNGEKTWCTFAGRSDVMLVLARTGTPEEGHKGLTLFLVEKPAVIAEDDCVAGYQSSVAGKIENNNTEYAFRFEQPTGGRVEGKAIRTIGYRGMHSFAVSFQDYFVPCSHQIGMTGEGFYLQMQGFSGGRIQTAARALGVMEAAFRSAIAYVKDRRLFGQSLAEFPLTQVRIAQMAAKIQACRQLTYATCAPMDKAAGNGEQIDRPGGSGLARSSVAGSRGNGGHAPGGDVEASLVKFLACREAEWVTREAMQLHGGMGYAEEYPVSRYWQDARVLSLFEGAEEVLGVMVIARTALEKHLDR